MRPKIGVFGFSGDTPVALKEKAFALGKAIGEQRAVLITGATTGLPYEAARGAKLAGGEVIGISPADSLEQHIHQYRMPVEFHDHLIFTGFGYIGRNVINVRTADACVIVNGGVGTLNELTGSFAGKRPIGILLASGGITNYAEEIKSMIMDDRFNTPILIDSNADKLVKKLISMVRK
ncbi:MAG: hypothetical protein GXP63_03250 [DPANN group archaeon]|nr:hypothetical protein [DPANN group archaeon]